MPYLCLTFDLEEFDLPLEYGFLISDSEMCRISYEGVIKVLDLLKRHKIKATFFVTAKMGKAYPELLKEIIGEKHEIGLHGYNHMDNYREMSEKKLFNRLMESKLILEKITGRKIIGFRSPQLNLLPTRILKEIGLKYDNSLHPTWVPTRYFHLFHSRNIRLNQGIISVPISVTPILRLPFSWFWFRNLGLEYAIFCTKTVLWTHNYINLYFHPWEFIDLTNLFPKIPQILLRRTGSYMLEQLEKYIIWCYKKDFQPLTIEGLIGKFQLLSMKSKEVLKSRE